MHYVYHFLCQPRRSCQDAETRTVSSCTASDRQLQLWSDDQYCFYVERQLKRSSASSNAVAPSPIVLPAPLSNCNPHPTPLDPKAISKLGDVVECSEFISVQTIRRRMDELEEQCAGADVIERKVVADFIEGTEFCTVATTKCNNNIIFNRYEIRPSLLFHFESRRLKNGSSEENPRKAV